MSDAPRNDASSAAPPRHLGVFSKRRAYSKVCTCKGLEWPFLELLERIESVFRTRVGD